MGGGRHVWDGLFSPYVCLCVCLLVVWTLRHYLASVIWGMQASPWTDTQDGPSTVTVTRSRNTNALNEGSHRKANLEKVKTSKEFSRSWCGVQLHKTVELMNKWIKCFLWTFFKLLDTFLNRKVLQFALKMKNSQEATLSHFANNWKRNNARSTYSSL